MSSGKHEHKNNNHNPFVATIGTIIVLLIAVGLFLYRDKLPGQSKDISQSKQEKQTIVSTGDPFTYENGSNQVFTQLNGRLAISSSTGLQVLDKSGATVCREVFSMNEPAVCTGGNDIIFYDIGSTSLRAIRNDTITNLDTENNIISVSANSQDYLAIAHKQAGYKGAVSVLNSDHTPIYEWSSGKGFVIDAAISPDSDTLAVLCLESGGCIIHILKISSEEELSVTPVSQQIFFDISFTSENTICSLSEKAILFYNTDGSKIQSYEFGDSFLAEYSLTKDITAVVLSKFVSGNNVSILSFTPDGEIKGEASLTEEPLSISSYKSRLLVLGSDLITVFSKEMSVKSQNHVVPGYRTVLLLPSNEVLLLSSHFGEKYSLT